MRAALSVIPGRPGSLKLTQREEAPPTEGALAIRTIAIGLGAADRQLVAGVGGALPPNKNELIIGREVVGIVTFGAGQLQPGDLVSVISRRPCAAPCPSCAAGEYDMCLATFERGLTRDGFAAERFRTDPGYAIKLPSKLGVAGVLLAAGAMAAKAWEHVERLGRRSASQPKTALIIGAGTQGLLAALMAKQRGFDVHVFDKVSSGRKPAQADALGVTYHEKTLPSADIIIECAGDAQLLWRAMDIASPDAVGCIVGPRTVTQAQHAFSAHNRVVVGVNGANRRHSDLALRSFAAADRSWLDRLITHKVPLAEQSKAWEPDDVKTAIIFSDL